MVGENDAPRCCSHCGSELGADGFAVKLALPDELPGEELVEEPVPEVPAGNSGSSFAAALRNSRRSSGAPKEGV